LKPVKSSDGFLKTADKIGSYLCSSAFWAGSRCNWIGRSLEGGITLKPNSLLPLANKSLGPEIYDGTSGIALFLSSLYDFTGKKDQLYTAEGAINHSLLNLESIHPSSRFGFYNGLVGIAYVSAKLALKLDNTLLLEKAISILKNLSRDSRTEHFMDVISGNAGAIPALLEMCDILREQFPFDLAEKLGNELLHCAVKDSLGWSWDSRANGIENTEYNLTGFSHGAAGIAYSLLELYGKTYNRRYRLAAEEGFKYENRWFNNSLNNWPDFRPIASQVKNHAGDYPYAVSWCHGAPGICLSRLHAYRILKDETYLKDCQAALSTTIGILGNQNNIDHDNYSLCHGLGGNCEPLIYAYETFGEVQYKSIAISVGRHGIERYGGQVSKWPCGNPTGQTPGLMLGLAGIGDFYLRLHDSKHTSSMVML
jgi:lantibiotic modifying enzyme